MANGKQDGVSSHQKADIADVPSSDVFHVSAIFLQPC